MRLYLIDFVIRMTIKLILKKFYVNILWVSKMLAISLLHLKSRSKIIHISIKNRGYQQLDYLLAFCLHRINKFYTGY